MNTKVFVYRQIARVMLECVTPIAIGDGTKDILTDAKVLTDANGLPFIPGTSLAGILRHAVGDATDYLWGFQRGKCGQGSRVIFTDAKLVDGDGTVSDGLVDRLSDFAQRYMSLPIRQHVNINQVGVASKGGKFDNEVVFAGTRFVFEVEILDDDAETVKAEMKQLRELISLPAFRVGGNTRRGLGQMRVVSWKERTIDMADIVDRNAYLAKSSSLTDLSFWRDIEDIADDSMASVTGEDWIAYRLILKPEDLFSFGSGLGDNEVDDAPLLETVVEWDHNGVGKFVDRRIVIPGSAVKGALSHRLAFHYNRLVGRYADKMSNDERDDCVGGNNFAVAMLFGKQSDKISRGNVIVGDCFPTEQASFAILNHVSIDPYTGGAIDGALYDEKVVSLRNDLTMIIYVEACAINDEKVREAWECTLDDVCNGMLPLGGAVNRGHGVFGGTWELISND